MKAILVILVGAATIFVVCILLFLRGVASGGEVAYTFIDVEVLPSDIEVQEALTSISRDYSISCVEKDEGGSCFVWHISGRAPGVVTVEMMARGFGKSVNVSSVPSHFMFFGPKSFTSIHRDVENALLKKLSGRVLAVERRL